MLSKNSKLLILSEKIKTEKLQFRKIQLSNVFQIINRYEDNVLLMLFWILRRHYDDQYPHQ